MSAFSPTSLTLWQKRRNVAMQRKVYMTDFFSKLLQFTRDELKSDKAGWCSITTASLETEYGI